MHLCFDGKPVNLLGWTYTKEGDKDFYSRCFGPGEKDNRISFCTEPITPRGGDKDGLFVIGAGMFCREDEDDGCSWNNGVICPGERVVWGRNGGPSVPDIIITCEET